MLSTPNLITKLNSVAPTLFLHAPRQAQKSPEYRYLCKNGSYYVKFVKAKLLFIVYLLKKFHMNFMYGNIEVLCLVQVRTASVQLSSGWILGPS